MTEDKDKAPHKDRPQLGRGRPPLPPGEKMERVMVQLTPAQIERAKTWGRGNLAEGVRDALDWDKVWPEFGSATGQEMRDLGVRIINNLRSDLRCKLPS